MPHSLHFCPLSSAHRCLCTVMAALLDLIRSSKFKKKKLKVYFFSDKNGFFFFNSGTQKQEY